MRISVLAGLLACAVLFGISSAKAEAATPMEVLDINQSETAVDTLLAVATVQDEAPAEPEPKEEPAAPAPQKHVIAEAESLEKIARQYDTTWKRIYDKNAQINNPDVVTPGMEIVIPQPQEEVPVRELPVVEPVVSTPPAPARSSSPAPAPTVQSSTNVSRGSSAGNGYVAGYCTWYVKNRRPDLPNNLGNAATWFSRAAAQGIGTGFTPRVGAAAQRGNHVAYVEAVNGDGTITISDMNYRALYTKTVRTVPASEWRYIY